MYQVFGNMCFVWDVWLGVFVMEILTLSVWNRIIGMIHFILGVRHEVVDLMCSVWFIWY